MTENFEEPKKSLDDHLKDDFDPRWSELATRGDLRIALIRIESKFDSLRTYIDTRFLSMERRFSKTERLHQIEIVMIVLGFLGIIIKPML